MAKIDITTAKNVIESNPRKAYFKIKNTGGPRGATGEQGPSGIPGRDGAQGVPGKAATVTVGSTTTLPAGSNATVTNSGDQYDAVLEFGIPTGPQGPTGATGEQGPRGFRGERGEKGDTGAAATITLGSVSTGAAGSDAAIVNTGDEHNAVYNFTIPRGAKGDTGTSPTVAVYGTTTLPAGSQATVTNVGTSQDVQLQFGIPQGEAGKNTKLYSSTGQNTDGAMTQKATTDALAPKIQTEVVAELPATGDEGKLYLTPKDYTTGTASGNPITITLGEDAGQITSAQLDGDTYQQSYTGKNLFEPLPYSNPTQQGLTTTIDGYELHVEGTSTTTYSNLTDNMSCSLPSGQPYTFCIDKVLTHNISLRTTWDGGYADRVIAPGNKSITFTPMNEIIGMRIFMATGGVGNTINETIAVQVVAGSTPDYDFERYTGGNPSPNPDYPQQIQTVTGEQMVTVVGENLLSSTWEDGGLDGATGEEASYSNSVRTADFVKVEPSETYILSRGGAGVAMNVFRYGSDKSFLYSSTISAGNVFTTSAQTQYVKLFRSSTGGTEQMQLQKGSTITPYTPYSKRTYPINLGKNLFDKNNYSDQTGYYIGSNGIWRSGGASDHYFVFRVEPNTTYTFSKNAQASNNRFRVGISSGEPTVGVAFSIWGGGDTATEITLTTASDSKYAYVYYSVTVNVQKAIQSLQIEAGSHKTSYAPYFTPIELCKLGDYQDYIYKDGSDWKVHKATKSVTLTGSENWQYRTAGTTADFYQINNANWNDYFGANTNAIGTGSTDVQPTSAFAADKLTSIDANDVNMKTYEGIGKKGQWFRISLLTSRGVTSVDDFKTWLASDNVKTYYALATATDTTITDTSLIAQLEAIRNATLQASNTITNTATGSNLAGDLELGYREYNPRNRYDKWLWLDLNNNYEQLGS